MTPTGFREDHARTRAPVQPGPADSRRRLTAQLRMSSAIVFLCAVFAISRAQAVPLMTDNFSGPVANANGQAPTFGPNPWSCSGPGAAGCIRGNGQMTSSNPGAGPIYYMMNTGRTPLELRYQFIDAKEPPAFVLAETRNGSLDNMWHAYGFNSGSSFVFVQSYWCTTAAGCPTSVSAVAAASQGSNEGPCPATVANKSYIGTLSFYNDTAIATLQDAASGALLCTNVARDPRLPSLIGPNFYLQSYNESPNVAFTFAQANDTARLIPRLALAPANIRAVATAVDASLLNNSPLFNSLGNLATGPLTDSLAQLSGEVASLSAGAAISASSDFMNLMLGPLSAARGGTQTGRPSGTRRRVVSDRFAI